MLAAAGAASPLPSSTLPPPSVPVEPDMASSDEILLQQAALGLKLYGIPVRTLGKGSDRFVRAIAAEKLKNKALVMGYSGMAYHSAEEGYNALKTMLTSEDILLVCGSVFLVAEVLKLKYIIKE